MNAATIVALDSRELAAAVPEREYRRLLRLPYGRALQGELLECARRARTWYACHGQPFLATRRMDLAGIGTDAVVLANCGTLEGAALAKRLKLADAHAVVAIAASAGAEVANEAARLWRCDRPDEAWFLDRFAAAIAESLVVHASTTMHLACRPRAERLLPHLSPGCGHWALSQQHGVMALLTGRVAPASPHAGGDSLGPLTLLPSGALYPPHSLLGVAGITHCDVAVAPESACRACDLDPCHFRRVPIARTASRPRLTA